jgi:hypothetical protein
MNQNRIAFGFFVAISLIVSCGTPAENGNNKMRSQDFFDEGMKLTSDRINLSDHDSIGKSELNKRAIQKFEAAYKADTTNRDAVFFASECTMFAKDYKKCIDWTTTLIHLDTSVKNRDFCYDRIAYCNQQVKDGIY